MKLISLNIWGGRVLEPLLEFLKTQAQDTDVFCFQEVYHTETDRTHSGKPPAARIDILNQLRTVLEPEYVCYFASTQESFDQEGRVDFHLDFGNAMFWRKDLPVTEQGEIFVFGEHNSRVKDDDVQPRNLQYITTQLSSRPVTVINFHGLWLPGTLKKDNPERFEQSKKINAFLAGRDGDHILVGDYNLLPDGQSLAMLEKGMRNLIKEHQITETRSSFYEKDIRLGDYALVTPGIEVKSFQALPDEVSDHLALELIFE